MKLAFSQSTNDLETLFKEFANVGYDGLQLKRNQYQPYLNEPQRFLDQHGNRPGAASALIVGWSQNDEATEYFRKVLAFGAAVGTELIVVCHGASREGLTSADIRTFAKTLSALGMEAKDSGLKLSLHHHVDQPVMHREDFSVFFDAVEELAVGLTVDTAHLVKSGIDDIAGLIRDMRSFIDNFHMKDLSDGDFKVLGNGVIGFAPVFAAIRDIGYKGWISADEESGADVISAMDQCFRFLSEGLSCGRTMQWDQSH